MELVLFAPTVPVATGSLVARTSRSLCAQHSARQPLRCHCPRLRIAPHASLPLVETHITLPGRGLALEVLTSEEVESEADPGLRPIVFVHGSLHGAWAWRRFLDYYKSRGLTNLYAVSLRGHTSQPPLPAGRVDVEDHLLDLEELIRILPGPAPVIVAHSIGGYYAQAVSQRVGGKAVGGLVLMASTPPSGNGALVWRTVKRFGIGFSWRLTMGFVRQNCAKDVAVCRELFFTQNEDIDVEIEGDDVLQEYMSNFAQAGLNPTDTRGIRPLKGPATADGETIPTLVVGGSEDTIVDEIAFEETARYWQSQQDAVVIGGAAHDLMLITKWQEAADIVYDWLVQARLVPEGGQSIAP